MKRDQQNIPVMDVPPPVTDAHRHAMYPDVSHDDRARLNFIAAGYRVAANLLTPGNELVYEKRVKPDFVVLFS